MRNIRRIPVVQIVAAMIRGASRPLSALDAVKSHAGGAILLAVVAISRQQHALATSFAAAFVRRGVVYSLIISMLILLGGGFGFWLLDPRVHFVRRAVARLHYRCDSGLRRHGAIDACIARICSHRRSARTCGAVAGNRIRRRPSLKGCSHRRACHRARTDAGDPCGACRGSGVARRAGPPATGGGTTATLEVHLFDRWHGR